MHPWLRIQTGSAVMALNGPHPLAHCHSHSRLKGAKLPIAKAPGFQSVGVVLSLTLSFSLPLGEQEPEPRQLVAELGASPSILIRQAQEEEQAPRRAGGLVLRVRVPIASNTPASGLPPAALRPASLAHCALLPPATAYPKSHHSTASTIRPPHPLTIARSFLQARVSPGPRAIAWPLSVYPPSIYLLHLLTT